MSTLKYNNECLAILFELFGSYPPKSDKHIIKIIDNMLFNGFDMRCTREGGASAIIVAVNQNRKELVEFLFQAGGIIGRDEKWVNIPITKLMANDWKVDIELQELVINNMSP